MRSLSSLFFSFSLRSLSSLFFYFSLRSLSSLFSLSLRFLSSSLCTSLPLSVAHRSRPLARRAARYRLSLMEHTIFGCAVTGDSQTPLHIFFKCAMLLLSRLSRFAPISMFLLVLILLKCMEKWTN
ncbi:hypothetical protein Scep_021828 [Stephania cephalantha]|uniref:Uncharacterized protein n=1 Tax=Stephania cephalantha TaxID=152367 RepID=A0AAP0I259_9MAGN